MQHTELFLFTQKISLLRFQNFPKCPKATPLFLIVYMLFEQFYVEFIPSLFFPSVEHTQRGARDNGKLMSITGGEVGD